MKNSDITDTLFREAIESIDAGNLSSLQHLLNTHSQLVSKRLDLPKGGYFKNPYLLWFVADNPIRNEKLPANICEITRLIVEHARLNAAESFQQQIDYALGLVVTGRIPRECGVQIELIDLLIDAGAAPGSGHGALAHGNIDAAQRLIERGGELTLATAICLDRADDIERLIKESTPADLLVALVASSFYGKSSMIKRLIEQGVDVNGYLDSSSGFHYHATALHQAVYSGSPDAVKILVEAGANLYAEDRIYHGTPIGWSGYMQTEENDEVRKKKYAEIETYLLSKKKE
jgi:hypothetical protein